MTSRRLSALTWATRSKRTETNGKVQPDQRSGFRTALRSPRADRRRAIGPRFPEFETTLWPWRWKLSICYGKAFLPGGMVRRDETRSALRTAEIAKFIQLQDPNNTIDINPNHVAMIKPSPDGDSGMVQILGFSGNSTDHPHASTVEVLSVVGPMAGSGTLVAVPAQHV